MNQNTSSSDVVNTVLKELRNKEIHTALEQLNGLDSTLNILKATIHLLDQRIQLLETNDTSSDEMKDIVDRSEPDNKLHESSTSKKKTARIKKTTK